MGHATHLRCISRVSEFSVFKIKSSFRVCSVSCTVLFSVVCCRQPHPIFDDVRKLITGEFVKQAYLTAVRQPNTDPPTVTFEWGVRAQHEVTKLQVLTFAAKVSVMVLYAHQAMCSEEFSSEIRL